MEFNRYLIRCQSVAAGEHSCKERGRWRITQGGNASAEALTSNVESDLIPCPQHLPIHRGRDAQVVSASFYLLCPKVPIYLPL